MTKLTSRCRLAPGEFLNDNLIDFCLKQLREELPAHKAVRDILPLPSRALGRLTSRSHVQERFHFFNCFFFKKLLGDEEVDLLPQGASHGERALAAHKRVARWSSRFDVFDKDYIVVPVNQSLHWTLAVIVNPGAAVAAAGPAPPAGNAREDAIELDLIEVIDVDAPPLAPPPAAAAEAPGPARSPMLLQMDSMGSSHRNVEPVLRDWLAVEWATKRNTSVEEGLRIFSTPGAHASHASLADSSPAEPPLPPRACAGSTKMPFVCADVPQQPNSVDCGLFLAEFARRFCHNAPDVFSQDGFPYFLKRSWFPAAQAGQLKRTHIHRSILALAGLMDKPPPLDGAGPQVIELD